MRRNFVGDKARAGCLALCFSLLLMAGCGGQRGANVSGKVTYQGAPMTSGAVTFHGENGFVQSSWIAPDGSYTITDAPFGTVKVAVVPSQTRETAARNNTRPIPKHPGDKGKAAPAGKPVNLPARYKDADQSGLTYTITKPEETFDIPLK